MTVRVTTTRTRTRLLLLFCILMSPEGLQQWTTCSCIHYGPIPWIIYIKIAWPTERPGASPGSGQGDALDGETPGGTRVIIREARGWTISGHRVWGEPRLMHVKDPSRGYRPATKAKFLSLPNTPFFQWSSKVVILVVLPTHFMPSIYCYKKHQMLFCWVEEFICCLLIPRNLVRLSYKLSKMIL